MLQRHHHVKAFLPLKMKACFSNLLFMHFVDWSWRVWLCWFFCLWGFQDPDKISRNIEMNYFVDQIPFKAYQSLIPFGTLLNPTIDNHCFKPFSTIVELNYRDDHCFNHLLPTIYQNHHCLEPLSTATILNYYWPLPFCAITNTTVLNHFIFTILNYHRPLF